MTMMPATTVGMNSLPINLISHGTAVNNTQRQIASSIGTAVLISILTNVTKSNQPGKSMLTTNPLGYRDHMINATLTGYHAAFAISLLFCILALITAFFLKNRGHSSDYTKKGDED